MAHGSSVWGFSQGAGSDLPGSIEPVVTESLSDPLNTENAGNVMVSPGRPFGAMVNTAYNVRQHTLVQEKELIAQMVVQLIPEDSTVFMTIGTTTETIARAMNRSGRRYYVITNSVGVAISFSFNPKVSVMLPSGMMRSSNRGLSGSETALALSRFWADYLITSAGAVKESGEIFDFNMEEIVIVQKMMERSANVILACDHSKFAATAPISMGNLSQVTRLVTDRRPNESIVRSLPPGALIVPPSKFSDEPKSNVETTMSSPTAEGAVSRDEAVKKEGEQV